MADTRPDKLLRDHLDDEAAPIGKDRSDRPAPGREATANPEPRSKDREQAGPAAPKVR